MTTSFEDLLTRAEKAPKRHRDVDVYPDDDTAERLAAIEQELEQLKADKRLGDARPKQLQDQIEAIQAEAAASVITLRFRRLPAEEWADIIARCPMRLDVAVDRLYGYNVHEAARAAAPESGVRLTRAEDGAEVEEDISEEHWERLFPVLAGRDFSRISDAIFDLNDYGPKQRLDAARKA